jgi:hypothetical protein
MRGENVAQALFVMKNSLRIAQSHGGLYCEIGVLILQEVRGQWLAGCRKSQNAVSSVWFFPDP